MENCRTCSERGADQCAAVWNFDAHVIACLRGSAAAAHHAGAAHISIAHFLSALCHDEIARNTVRGLGVDPRALELELGHLLPASRQRAAQGRMVLSQSLNALLIAAEQTAHHAGHRVVTLELVMATVMQNAAHDEAAGLFHGLAFGSQRQPHVSFLGVSHQARPDLQLERQLKPRTVRFDATSPVRGEPKTGYQPEQSYVHSNALQHGHPDASASDASASYARARSVHSARGLVSRSDGPSQSSALQPQYASRQVSSDETSIRANTAARLVGRDGAEYTTPAVRPQRTQRGANAATASMSAQRVTLRSDHTDQRTPTEHEHFETLLRMLRVQEARLERLETNTERTSDRASVTSGKSGRLKIRKIALSSLSGRGGQSAKAQSKRQSQSRSGASGAANGQVNQAPASASDRSGDRSASRSSSAASGSRERTTTSGTSSQSRNSGLSRSYDNGSGRGSYADRDHTSDRDRNRSSARASARASGRDWERDRRTERDHDRDRASSRDADRQRDDRRTRSSGLSGRDREQRDWTPRERGDRERLDRATERDTGRTTNRATHPGWGGTLENRARQESSHQKSSSERTSRSNTSTRSHSETRSERSDRSARSQSRTEPTDSKKEKRFYLSLEDDLVDAPSIGPKTAARFTPLGIHTVRDLLHLDADAIAAQLKVRHISADVLRDWQDQARLVCTVPWLRGTHAQLLVGADYRHAEDLAKADLGEVLASILRFAATNQGERILRTNPPPEREKVATWLGFAKQSDMSRVA